MYLKNLLPLFVLLLAVGACNPDADTSMAEMDLMEHGMPIVIKAPEGAEVKKMDLVLSQDISVIQGPDFHVQIFESNADTRDVAEIKGRLLKEIKRHPYFYALLQDDSAGFIYETRVDSNYINYGFRHVRIQGDKEYIFQQGLQGRFTREAVESMYRAVQ